jgi:hypothetical protein
LRLIVVSPVAPLPHVMLGAELLGDGLVAATFNLALTEFPGIPLSGRGRGGANVCLKNASVRFM